MKSRVYANKPCNHPQKTKVVHNGLILQIKKDVLFYERGGFIDKMFTGRPNQHRVTEQRQVIFAEPDKPCQSGQGKNYY